MKNNKDSVEIKLNPVSILLAAPLMFMIYGHIFNGSTYHPMAIFAGVVLFVLGAAAFIVSNSGRSSGGVK